MKGIDTWIESISSMHIFGADLDGLFNAVPESLRNEVRSEWDRRTRAYEASKDTPIDEIKAEVLPRLREHRIQQLYEQIYVLRAEVAALRAQLETVRVYAPSPYTPPIVIGDGPQWWRLQPSSSASGTITVGGAA